jgi:hypothetical protein
MVIGFRLVLKRQSDGRLCLTVPLFYKLLQLAIGVLILTFMILIPPEGERRLFVPANTLPLIICVLSLLGAAYHERWIFDKARDRVVSQYGITFLHSNRSCRISGVQGLVVERFIKGKLDGAATARRTLGPASVLTVSLHGKDGSVRRLETYSGSQKSRMEATARAIAFYCDIPLVRQDGSLQGDS